MPLTAAGEVAALNGLCTSRYVGLHTGDPSGGANEVSGGAYARQSFVFSNAGGNPTVASNSGVITFPTATAAWGTVTHVALWAAVSGGSVLAYAALNTSKSVSIDDVVRFATGQLSFSAD